MSYTSGIELTRRNKNRLTLKQCLNKVYIIKARPNQSGGLLFVPDALVGKRIKIVEVK